MFAAMLLLSAGLAACSGQGQGSSNPLRIVQPTFAELSRFLPGGVVAHDVPREAPIPCGGSANSIRTEVTAVRVPGSLLTLSVANYRFPSSSDVRSYLHAVTAVAATAQAGACPAQGAPSGAIYSAPIGYLTNDGYYLMTAPTKLGPGIYSGAYLYISIAYVANGDDVSVVRVDRQAGYANEAFMGSLLTMLEAPGGPKLNTGSHSAQFSTSTATLRRANYSDYVGGANPAVTTTLCPEAIIDGVTYNITLERQLPHTTPAGLVVPGAKEGTSTTIRWGDKARVVVDLVDTSESEPGDECVNGTGARATMPREWVRIVSIRPAA